MSIAGLEAKIRTLESAKNQVERIRKRFKTGVRDKDKDLLKDEYYWKGANQADFMYFQSEDILTENKRYDREGFETVIEDMEAKIRQLKKELAAARRRARKNKKKEDK